MNENKQTSVMSTPNRSSENLENTFWHSRAGSLYTSVKNTVLSFFEGDSLNQQVGSSQKAPTQGSSRIRKFVANTSFVVGGLVGGLALAPVAHADPQNAPAAPSTAIAPKTVKPHIPTVLEQKATAEKNQAIIDTRLKTLLVLKGKKGALEHEGVPSSVKDYGPYIIAQKDSMVSLDKKIKKLTAKNASTKPVSQASTHASKKHPPKIKHQKQEPKNQGIVALQNSTPEILVASSDNLALFAPNLTFRNNNPGVSVFGGLAFEQPVPTSMLDQTVGSTTPLPPSVLEIAVPSLGPVDIPLARSMSMQGDTPALPPSASVVMTAGAAPVDASIVKDDKANTATVIVPTSAVPAASVNPPKKVSKVENVKTKNVSKSKVAKTISVAPGLGSTALSGLNQDTVTEKKLEEFLSRVNIILASADKKLGLKGASFTYKTVTVKRRVKEGKDIKLKAVPALRIFLKQGKHTGYVTVPLKHESCEHEYLSPNYRYISSESKLIDWAERKTKKWSQIQKKK